MKMNEHDSLLRSIHYDLENAASFSSARDLYKAAKSSNSFITQKLVNDWLSGEFTYILHKPIKKNFIRNPIVVEFINEQWQADLADMRQFKAQNDSHQYILTVIDVFSKYAWAIPLKNKSAKVVSEAFNKLFEESKPVKLQTDEGGEFDNKLMAIILKKHDIKYFTAKNKDIKCSVVERFNRTLKSRMFKYFTSKGTRRYVDILPAIVDSYNSYHQSIKEKPVNVVESNEKRILFNLYGVPSKRTLLRNKIGLSKIAANDTVRLKYRRGLFDKKFYPNWTDETFEVAKTIKGMNKPFYKLKTSNKQLKRNFHPEEVQKIAPNRYRVESILKTRKRGGKTEFFVKWLNHPSTENSWIKSDNLNEL